jgi:hypothetical protein
MDTIEERQLCFDTCQFTQTYPDACEAAYIALNDCRSDGPLSYRCNSAGEPVPTTSCLFEQVALGYCKQQNPTLWAGFVTPDCGLQPWDPHCSGDNGSGGGAGGGGGTGGGSGQPSAPVFCIPGTPNCSRSCTAGQVWYIQTRRCGPPPGSVCGITEHNEVCEVTSDGRCICPDLG